MLYFGEGRRWFGQEFHRAATTSPGKVQGDIIGRTPTSHAR